MSRYNAYPVHKDSRVDWIDELPEHWARVSIKYILSTPITDGPHETPVFVDKGIEFLSVDGIQDGELLFEGKRFISHEDHIRFSRKAKPQINDVLVGKSASVGKVARVKSSKEFNIWSPLAILRADQERCDPAYLEFSLKGGAAQRQILLAGNISTQANISMDRLASVGVALPPLKEQRQIVKVIKRETSRIDTLITKKTRFIELLKEKRQAVITKAVTKGLDDSVKMKDSRVAWIGEVPAHWDVTALKRIVGTPITDGPHETPVFHDDGVPFVSAEAVSSGRINFEKIRGFISREDHERFSRKYLPQKNDIYMVKSGATTGVTAIVEDDREFNIWSPLAVIRCSGKAHPPYVLLFMRSKNFLDAVALNWSYGTQQNIGMGVLGNLSIALPSYKEQMVIADSVNRKIGRLNELVNKTERSIELLKEKRSALITAAVTGKIDVREAA